MATKTEKKGASSSGGHIATDNGQPDGSSKTYHSVTWDNIKHGVDLPTWRSLIASHGNATTNAASVYRLYQFGSGAGSLTFYSGPPNDRHTRITTVYGVRVTGQRTLLSDPGSALSLTVDSAARIKFLQDIRATQRKFQGGVFLGELRETLRLIKNPLLAFRRGIDSYYRTVKIRGTKAVPRRGKNSVGRRRAAIIRRVASETWLEAMFGWRPLLHDIDDAAKALATQDFREFIPISGRSRALAASDSNTTHTQGFFSWITRWRLETESSVWYVGEVSGGPRTPHFRPSHWGVALNDFVPTVWELIPYSFLVDYFTNAGNLIDAMTTDLSGLAWHCRTSRITRREIFLAGDVDWAKIQLSISPSDLGPASIGFGGSENTIRRTQRDVPILQLGLSDFSFKLPGVGSTKWLNIGALAGMRRF